MQFPYVQGNQRSSWTSLLPFQGGRCRWSWRGRGNTDLCRTSSADSVARLNQNTSISIHSHLVLCWFWAGKQQTVARSPPPSPAHPLLFSSPQGPGLWPHFCRTIHENTQQDFLQDKDDFYLVIQFVACHPVSVGWDEPRQRRPSDNDDQDKMRISFSWLISWTLFPRKKFGWEPFGHDDDDWKMYTK